MITRYYGGLYFSYKQAIDLDCIEHFVFKTEGIKKNKLLAALLSTTSEIVNTVGKQFAQPLKVSNGKGQYKKSLLKKIIDDRSLDVFSIYRRWLIYYLSIEENKNSFDIICDDYVRVFVSLNKLPCGLTKYSIFSNSEDSFNRVYSIGDVNPSSFSKYRHFPSFS